MKINKNESKIVGHWSFNGSKMIADDQCKRIEWLTNNYLIKVGTDYSGWDVLYRDPDDKRYWELIYTNSELHGGGSPSLILLSENKASSKYNL